MSDVIVVGAGVIGASIAYHLARAGSQVRIYDRADAPCEPSASWASAGGVRSQNRDPREWKLAVAAAKRWPQLDAELRAQTRFRQAGHLHVVENEHDAAELRARVERERSAGIEIEYLDSGALRRVAPALAATFIAGAYTPGDGAADPRATTYAFTRAAQREGATVVRTFVEGIAREGDTVAGVIAGGNLQRAQTTVLAAGSWSMKLADAIGLALPVTIRGYQMVLSMPSRRVLEPTVTATGRALSLKQLVTGAFLIGGGWGVEVDERAHTCRPVKENVEASWDTALAIVPELAATMPSTAWGGLESEAHDGVPLIGPAPGLEGLYVAVGFSGHGFQIAPAVGDAVAQAIRSGTQPDALALLTP
jgi:sarcosine oxidase subunit beta